VEWREASAGSPAKSAGAMYIRRASPQDLDAIHDLLREAELPVSDVSLELGPFVLAEADHDIVGVAGVECLGSVGLLRSVAVGRLARNLGIATWLCSEATEAARGHGIRELHLLTTTAPRFFGKLGFAPIARSAAPSELQGSREFRELCPETSVLMYRLIDDPSGAEAISNLREAYDAFLRGEPTRLLALLAEGAIYHLPGKHMGGGRLDGRRAIVQRAAAAARAFDEPPAVSLLNARGDERIVITTERFSARRGPCTLDQTVRVVWRFEELNCLELWVHFDDQRACDVFWAGWPVQSR